MPEPEIRSLFAFTTKVATEGEGFDIEAVGSDATLDRDGEVIEPDGWMLDNYLSNPVILACHQHRLADGHSPVVGSAPDTQVRDGRLVHRIGFAAGEKDGTELGREYRNLYRGKYMRAFSVGFRPMGGGMKTTSGGGKSSQVYHHTKVELFETSCVPVGSNPAALARYLKSVSASVAAVREGGPLSEEDLAKLAALISGRLPDLKSLESEIRNLKSEFDRVVDAIAAAFPDNVNPDAAQAKAPDWTAEEDEEEERHGAEDKLRRAASALAQLGK